MSATIAQIDANRANATASTGPATEAGKKRASQNARRHGFTASVLVMSDEDRAAYDLFRSEMLNELKPVGATENWLAGSIVDESWRIDRIRAHCNNLTALSHFESATDRYDVDHPEVDNALTGAAVARDHAHALALLSLYEQRAFRSLMRCRTELLKLQTERTARFQADMQDAIALRQAAQVDDQPFNPAETGFVFSNDDIDRFLDRWRRIQRGQNFSYEFKKRAGIDDPPSKAFLAGQ